MARAGISAVRSGPELELEWEPKSDKNGWLPMKTKPQHLQEPFLNALCRKRVPVSLDLLNGVKLQGQIESFDPYVVKNALTQMVYEDAISIMVPARAVSLSSTAEVALR